VIRLDGATFLLQWASGGLAFLWVTSRRREVGLGFGWLLRGVFGLMALAAVVLGFALDPIPVREAAGIGVIAATAAAFAVSVVRRREGIDGFPLWLDAVAPAIGVVGLVAAGIDAGSPAWLSVLRTLVGAAFLGVVSDSMLLGHWYLVQPGLARRPLLELVRLAGVLLPVEVLVMLLPTGMISVLDGSVDDEYGGILGWMWLACAVTTGGLLVVTRAALRERQYAAVMAATGLLYLAILTAFGTDLVARAVLA
jgi:hypothetical protein